MTTRSICITLLLLICNKISLAQDNEINKRQIAFGRKLSLSQNYPNPAERQQTVIPYTAIDAYHFFIVVTDASDKHILTFTDLPSVGEVVIDTDRLAPGIYTYALVVNGRMVERKKMIIK